MDEKRIFEARDRSGKSYVIIAIREVIILSGRERIGPWTYLTKDGKRVLPTGRTGSFMVEDDGILLTTSDPKEPKDS